MNPRSMLLRLITMLLLASLMQNAASQTTEPEPAGRVLAVSGAVHALGGDGERRELRRRSKLFSGDAVHTASDAQAQLRLSDGSLIALRGDSEWRIDEYRSPATESDPRNFSTLVKGGLRTLTGAIGKQDPAQYRLDTPLATIGIRGTEFEVVLTEELALAVWHGTIQVRNRAGAMELGESAAFRFATVGSATSAPKGSLAPPASLRTAPHSKLPRAARTKSSTKTPANRTRRNTQSHEGDKQTESSTEISDDEQDSEEAELVMVSEGDSDSISEPAADPSGTDDHAVDGDRETIGEIDLTTEIGNTETYEDTRDDFGVDPPTTDTDTDSDACTDCDTDPTDEPDSQPPPPTDDETDGGDDTPTDPLLSPDLRLSDSEWQALQASNWLGLATIAGPGASPIFGGRAINPETGSAVIIDNGLSPDQNGFLEALPLEILRQGDATNVVFRDITIDNQHRVYWGAWDTNQGPAVVQIDALDPNQVKVIHHPVFWAAMTPSDSAAMGARSGTVHYNHVLDAIGGGSAGMIDHTNLIFQADVNFDTGAVQNGQLDVYGTPETWNTTFSGAISGSVVHIDPADVGGQMTDGIVTFDVDGELAIGFTGQQAQALGGAFNLEARQDPNRSIEGLFLVDCSNDTNC